MFGARQRDAHRPIPISTTLTIVTTVVPSANSPLSTLLVLCFRLLAATTSWRRCWRCRIHTWVFSTEWIPIPLTLSFPHQFSHPHSDHQLAAVLEGGVGASAALSILYLEVRSDTV